MRWLKLSSFHYDLNYYLQVPYSRVSDTPEVTLAPRKATCNNGLSNLYTITIHLCTLLKQIYVYATLLESTSDWVFLFFFFVNKHFVTILNYFSDNEIGLHVNNLIIEIFCTQHPFENNLINVSLVVESVTSTFCGFFSALPVIQTVEGAQDLKRG